MEELQHSCYRSLRWFVIDKRTSHEYLPFTLSYYYIAITINCFLEQLVQL